MYVRRLSVAFVAKQCGPGAYDAVRSGRARSRTALRGALERGQEAQGMFSAIVILLELTSPTTTVQQQYVRSLDGIVNGRADLPA